VLFSDALVTTKFWGIKCDKRITNEELKKEREVELPLIEGPKITKSFPRLKMMLMLNVWDHDSELQPPMGLSFIPQVINEYREPWWNDRGKPKKSREKSVPVSPCPTQISHGFTLV
jgi:hypothetical protein